MLKNTLFSFGHAIHNIRTNLFHTILSVFGIVIGVAALVAILSFIDGLEQFAREQITKTTGLNVIALRSEAYQTIDDIRLKKDSFALLSPAVFERLTDSLPNVSRTALRSNRPAELRLDTSTKALGAILEAATPYLDNDTVLLAGRLLTQKDVADADSVIVINQVLAKQATGHERWSELIGKPLHWKAQSLRVVGVTKAEDPKERPKGIFPISLLQNEALRADPPIGYVEVDDVEQVQAVKKQIEARVETQFPNQKEDIQIVTNEFRLDQTAKGFFLFRIIMGLIVGISIVVGGVGVMNVLLISVNERTTEIGIRKAVGASRRHIIQQFLAESITVSAFGSFLGLLVGVLATMIIIPIIKMVTDLPFEAVYTWNTFLTISIVAVLVGIIFGTYPAMKASKLDPVEAIRRE
ncbi:MAG: ABC transporter permease [Saprospiraceae bacterium]|nr:ABC transporter permease [Saprospiraceae bacterium]